jgi:hyaluronate lyase
MEDPSHIFHKEPIMSQKPLKLGLLYLAGIVLPGAMCFPSTPSQEIIVDNLDSGFAIIAGTWGEANSSDGNGSYGPNFRYHEADQTNVGIARFTPTITHAGSYAVYIYWSADPNRTTSQPVIVHGSGGDMTYYVNLRQNGHQWFLLGNHVFNSGTSGYIDFTTNTASGFCNADAVRLVSNF